jgi:hypothetical protein
VSGSRDYRPNRLRPDDDTVEVPLRPHAAARVPAVEEPWWKNVNTRVPQPPKPAQRAPAKKPPPIQASEKAAVPVASRHSRGSARRKGAQLPMLIAVAVIAIAGAAVLVLVGLSRIDVLKGKVLDVSQAEAGVRRILTDQIDGYGATNVTDVACNGGADPHIRKGGTFGCDVVVDGRKRHVLVAFQDDNGTYEVDRPR